MISAMHIENYKCFKSFKLAGLGPFNVLIGPNDSGKTAFLEAMRILTALTPATGAAPSSLGHRLGIPLGPQSVWRQEKSAIRIEAQARRTDGRPGHTFQVAWPPGGNLTSDVVTQPNRPDLQPPNWKSVRFSENVGKADYYQFDPSALRRPSPLAMEMTRTGNGLPTFLDDINRTDREVFRKLEAAFYRRFPFYKTIVIDKTTATIPDFGAADFYKRDCFVLKFKTVHGGLFPAEGVSDGVMISLAFIALCYSPDPPKILLIEEPENHVHHASLKETIRTLRDLSQEEDVQVILTTHSPYLVDLVQPEEVWVFAKDDAGAAQATSLAAYPDVEKMKKHFMTGEIWTGLDEADIVKKARGEK